MFLEDRKMKVSVMLIVKEVPDNVVLYLDSTTVLFCVYYYPLINLESVFRT